MSKITNRELMKELVKPGKIYMPVISSNDTVHIAVQKTDLLDILSTRPPDDFADWCFYGEYEQGRKLDIQD